MQKTEWDEITEIMTQEERRQKLKDVMGTLKKKDSCPNKSNDNEYGLKAGHDFPGSM